MHPRRLCRVSTSRDPVPTPLAEAPSASTRILRGLLLRRMDFTGSSVMNSPQENSDCSVASLRWPSPPPQNHLVHNALQGITSDEFPVQNEMLSYCRWEQSIDRRGAKNAEVERHDAGRAEPQESGPGLRSRLRVAARAEEGSRGPRRVPPTPCGGSSNEATWDAPCPPPS